MTTRRRMIFGLALLPVAGLAVMPLSHRAQAETIVTQAMTVDQMRANGGLIVDIRRPEEWAETGVIDGARLVTFDGAERFLAELGPEIASGRDLILVCRSGRRTAAAAEALAGRIPNRIISVDGGMISVVNGGYSPVPAP
jgi:phage shock protein E